VFVYSIVLELLELLNKKQTPSLLHLSLHDFLLLCLLSTDAKHGSEFFQLGITITLMSDGTGTFAAVALNA